MRSSLSATARIAAVYLIVLLVPSAARAQVDLLPFQHLTEIQFTAGRPGARSLALAGAGIGLADDASWSVLNRRRSVSR